MAIALLAYNVHKTSNSSALTNRRPVGRLSLLADDNKVWDERSDGKIPSWSGYSKRVSSEIELKGWAGGGGWAGVGGGGLEGV